jgi:hypothetical protein
MVAWYCAFFLSGRVVSTIPPTLSILQCNRPAAMNRESSLNKRLLATTKPMLSSRLVSSRHVIPIQKVTRNTKGLRHGLELNTLVRLQQLGIGQDSHFAHEIARVRADEPIVLDAIRDERCNIGPMAGCTTGALVLMIRAPCGDSDFGGAMPHERLGIGNNIPRAPKNSLYSLLYNEFRNDERCGISRMTDKTSGASMTFSRRRGRSSDRMLVMTA